MKFRKPSYRPSAVPILDDPYSVTTDPAPLIVPPEGPRENVANALQICELTNPMEQGARDINEALLAISARLIKALAQLDGRALPQADGSPT